MSKILLPSYEIALNKNDLVLLKDLDLLQGLQLKIFGVARTT